MVLIPLLGCQPPTKPHLSKAPPLLRFYQTMGQISSMCNVNSDPNHSKTKIELTVGVSWSCPCFPAFLKKFYHLFIYFTWFYISSVKILSEHPFRMCLRSHHGVWWFLWNSLLTGTIHMISVKDGDSMVEDMSEAVLHFCLKNICALEIRLVEVHFRISPHAVRHCLEKCSV